ncbi:MAG: hypothetical protein AAF658_15425, partial [Myxococcota bacterium]
MNLDDEVVIQCSGSDECPDGFSCDPRENLCVRGLSVAERPAPPAVRLTAVAPPGERFVNEVDLRVEVDDPNFPVGDTVVLSFEFSTGSNSGPWESATLGADSPLREGTVTATSDEVVQWDAVANAGGSLPFMDDETGENAPTVGLIEQVWFRVTAVDATSREVTEVIELEPIGNTLPIAVVEPFVDEFYNGSIPVRVAVQDTSADRSDIEVQFRTPGDTDFRRASVPAELSTSVNTGVSEGITTVLIWPSLVPPDPDPTVPQGVGQETVSDLEVRARAIDGPSGDESTVGPWSPVTVLPQVRNQTPPQIT